MLSRRSNLRLLAGALLLFGLAFEVGHMHHHLEHAHHHADKGHGSHRDCLVFHDGVVTEATVRLVVVETCVELEAPSSSERFAAVALHRLPDSRAPPAFL